MATTASQGGLTVTAHVGDRCVLLAFDVDPARRKDLAGFAIQCTADGAPTTFWLTNLLTFDTPVGSAPDPGRRGTPSNVAPFQSFHWSHFPRDTQGRFSYAVWPVYFTGGRVTGAGGGIALRDAMKTVVTVDLAARQLPRFELGFTRGYMSSQAYLAHFGADPAISPKVPAKPAFAFDTRPYAKKYEWLGAHARALVMDFLARAGGGKSLDVLAYDLNEPDVVRALAGLGDRLRIVIDDYTKKDRGGKTTGHGLPGSPESAAARLLRKAGAQVVRTHFKRFAHDKVLILKDGERPVSVLTGSANFSLRGLYVQSNSVIVVDDPEVAGWYEHAFEQAFSDAAHFPASPIAARWFAKSNPTAELPSLQISFAPHPAPPFSIESVAQAIRAAQTSVLFAVMSPSGGGDVMKDLEAIGSREGLFSLGTIEGKKDLTLFRDDLTSHSAVVPFAYLREHVPTPFLREYDAGMGQHIHHKFVVCDFNGPNPIVFCGSSNLASGGEAENGDNLLAIADRAIATAYAVEAVQLFDHYRFRSRQASATDAAPMVLAATDAWTGDFYDPASIRCLERSVLAKAEAAPAPAARIATDRETGRTRGTGARRRRTGTGS
jgi:PLD-like domain